MNAEEIVDNTKPNPSPSESISSFERKVESWRESFEQDPNLRSQDSRTFFGTMTESLKSIAKAKIETPYETEDDVKRFEDLNAGIIALNQVNLNLLLDVFQNRTGKPKEQIETLIRTSQRVLTDSMLDTYMHFEDLIHSLDEDFRVPIFTYEDRRRAAILHKNYLYNRVKDHLEDGRVENFEIRNSDGVVTSIFSGTIELDANGQPIVTEEEIREISDEMIAVNLSIVNATKGILNLASKMGVDLYQYRDQLALIDEGTLLEWFSRGGPESDEEFLGWATLFILNANWQICQEPKTFLQNHGNVEGLGAGVARLESFISLLQSKDSSIIFQNIVQARQALNFIEQDINLSNNETPEKEPTEFSKEEFREALRSESKEILDLMLKNESNEEIQRQVNIVAQNGVLSQQSVLELGKDLRRSGISKPITERVQNSLNNAINQVLFRAEGILISDTPENIFTKSEQHQVVLVDGNYKVGIIEDINDELVILRSLLENQEVDENGNYSINWNGNDVLISGETHAKIFSLASSFGVIEETEESLIVQNVDIDFWNAFNISDQGVLTLNPLPEWDQPTRVYYSKDSEGKKSIQRVEIQDGEQWVPVETLGPKLTGKNFSGIQALEAMYSVESYLGGRDLINTTISNSTREDLERVVDLMRKKSELSQTDLIIMAFLRFSNATWATFTQFEGLIDANKKIDEPEKAQAAFDKRISHRSLMPYSDLLDLGNILEIEKDMDQGKIAVSLLNR